MGVSSSGDPLSTSRAGAAREKTRAIAGRIERFARSRSSRSARGAIAIAIDEPAGENVGARPGFVVQSRP
jgi:hypothetical protein